MGTPPLYSIVSIYCAWLHTDTGRQHGAWRTNLEGQDNSSVSALNKEIIIPS